MKWNSRERDVSSEVRIIPPTHKKVQKSILLRISSLARIQLFIFIVCNSEVQFRARELSPLFIG